MIDLDAASLLKDVDLGVVDNVNVVIRAPNLARATTLRLALPEMQGGMPSLNSRTRIGSPSFLSAVCLIGLSWPTSRAAWHIWVAKVLAVHSALRRWAARTGSASTLNIAAAVGGVVFPTRNPVSPSTIASGTSPERA